MCAQRLLHCSTARRCSALAPSSHGCRSPALFPPPAVRPHPVARPPLPPPPLPRAAASPPQSQAALQQPSPAKPRSQVAAMRAKRQPAHQPTTTRHSRRREGRSPQSEPTCGSPTQSRCRAPSASASGRGAEPRRLGSASQWRCPRRAWSSRPTKAGVLDGRFTSARCSCARHSTHAQRARWGGAVPCARHAKPGRGAPATCGG